MLVLLFYWENVQRIKIILLLLRPAARLPATKGALSGPFDDGVSGHSGLCRQKKGVHLYPIWNPEAKLQQHHSEFGIGGILILWRKDCRQPKCPRSLSLLAFSSVFLRSPHYHANPSILPSGIQNPQSAILHPQSAFVLRSAFVCLKAS